MNPGIHPGTPWSVYFADEGLNHSSLKWMERSPLHCRYHQLHSSETAATILGTAKHTALFEPGSFEELYAVAPVSDKRKREWKEFSAANADKTILKPTEVAEITALVESLYADADIADLLRAPGHNECSLIWERDGVRCKGRIDAIRHWQGWTFVVDLKNMAANLANERETWRWFERYGTASQAAWYLDGLERIEPFPRRHLVLAVESLPPFGAKLVEISPEELAEASKQNSSWFETYHECLRADAWPGYPSGIYPAENPYRGVQ